MFVVWADEEWLKKYAMKEDEDDKGENEDATKTDENKKPARKNPKVTLKLIIAFV